MSDLPGFSSRDMAPLPTKAQMREEERGVKALSIYYGVGGNLSKVRKELKLRSNAEAQVLINRALKAWRARADDHVTAVQYLHTSTLEEAHRRLAARALGEAEDGSDMDLAAFDRLMKAEERQAKLHASDAEKDAPTGPQVLVIDSRFPWEREAPIEAEIVPQGEIEAGEVEND